MNMNENTIYEKLDQIAQKLQYAPLQSQKEIDIMIAKELTLTRDQYMRALYYKGIASMFLEDYPNVIKLGEEIKRSSQKTNDEDNLIRAYSLLGIGNCYSNRFYESLLSFFYGYKLAVRADKKAIIATLALNLSEVLLHIEEFEHAEAYIHTALAHAENLGLDRLYMKAQLRMAEIKLQSNEVQAAKIIITDISCDEISKLEALDLFYYNIICCDVYTKNGSVQEARKHLEQAATYLEKIQLIQLKIHFNVVAGELSCQIGDYESSRSYFDAASALSEAIDSLVFRIRVTKGYINLYEVEGAHEKTIERLRHLRKIENQLYRNFFSYDLMLESIENSSKSMYADKLEELARANDKITLLETRINHLTEQAQLQNAIHTDHSDEEAIKRFSEIVYSACGIKRFSLYSLTNNESVCFDIVHQVPVDFSKIPDADEMIAYLNRTLGSTEASVYFDNIYLNKSNKKVFFCFNKYQGGIIAILEDLMIEELSELAVNHIYKCMNQLLLLIRNHEKPSQLSLSDYFNYIQLTDREREIVDCVCKGYTNNEISSKLIISAFTVRNHLSKIYQKMKVNTRFELIQMVSSYK